MTAPAVRVVYWWDRYSRNWIIQALDREGNQVGDAYYSANSRTLLSDVNSMLDLHKNAARNVQKLRR